MADERGRETYLDKDTRQYRSRETQNYGGSDKSIANAVSERQERSQSALAAAAARAKAKTPMPKQNEGESSSAYAERLRVWRREQE